MPKKRSNDTILSSPSTLRVLLSAALALSATTLLMLPFHFSLIAMIVFLTSLLGLISAAKSPKKLQSMRKEILLCFCYSLAYGVLILQWKSADPLACSEFFGAYRSCLGSAQQVLIELIASPVIFLSAAWPILKRLRE